MNGRPIRCTTCGIIGSMGDEPKIRHEYRENGKLIPGSHMGWEFVTTESTAAQMGMSAKTLEALWTVAEQNTVERLPA